MFDAELPFRAPGRYPDRVSASVPKGFRDQVKRAAEAERIGSAEFIRRAVEREVAAVLADNSAPKASRE